MSEGELCPCGWKRPSHVVARYPKDETPPSSVELTLTCPTCGAGHVAILAKDMAAFEKAKRTIGVRG